MWPLMLFPKGGRQRPSRPAVCCHTAALKDRCALFVQGRLSELIELKNQVPGFVSGTFPHIGRGLH